MSETSSLLRNIPSVDELLRTEAVREIASDNGYVYTTDLARRIQNDLRKTLHSEEKSKLSKDALIQQAIIGMTEIARQESSSRLRNVINCTGVVIHTNLGRAPLSRAARLAIDNEAAGYCTLEYDTGSGRRGKRAPRCEDLIQELTGAEAALVVNNCAAAAFFVLTVLAKGTEVLISRGEMVEIGGDFRVPDVLEQSGAILREVGTTNRTKLADYAAGLDDGARFVLRVHPSNYRIIGFTSTPSLSELADLAHDRGAILYEDIGSGAIVDLSDQGLTDEPVVRSSIGAGADIVTFSGDKLLGGPQAGIIAGRRVLIEKLRRHPLYRALRVGKLIYAGLEATLAAYRRGSITEVPVINMLSLDPVVIRERSESFIDRLSEAELGRLSVELKEGTSTVGGGAAPGVNLPTVLIALHHPSKSAVNIDRDLRRSEPPVIARIENDRVLLDLRTVLPDEEKKLIEVLRSIA